MGSTWVRRRSRSGKAFVAARCWRNLCFVWPCLSSRSLALAPPDPVQGLAWCAGTASASSRGAFACGEPARDCSWGPGVCGVPGALGCAGLLWSLTFRFGLHTFTSPLCRFLHCLFLTGFCPRGVGLFNQPTLNLSARPHVNFAAGPEAGPGSCTWSRLFWQQALPGPNGVFLSGGFRKPVVWGQRIVLKVRHQKAPQFVSRAALTYGGTSRGKRSCEPWYLLLLTSNLF